MQLAEPTVGWEGASLAFAFVLIASFLVTFLVTAVLRAFRTTYVAILALTVAALVGAYLGWSGTSVSEVARSKWAGVCSPD